MVSLNDGNGQLSGFLYMSAQVLLIHGMWSTASTLNTVRQPITESCTYESGRATWQLSVSLLLGARSAAFVDTSKIHCPVLVIGGTEDRITPIRIQRDIAKYYGQQCRLVEIEGCDHWTMDGRFIAEVERAIKSAIRT